MRQLLVVFRFAVAVVVVSVVSVVSVASAAASVVKFSEIEKVVN